MESEFVFLAFNLVQIGSFLVPLAIYIYILRLHSTGGSRLIRTRFIQIHSCFKEIMELVFLSFLQVLNFMHNLKFVKQMIYLGSFVCIKREAHVYSLSQTCIHVGAFLFAMQSNSSKESNVGVSGPLGSGTRQKLFLDPGTPLLLAVRHGSLNGETTVHGFNWLLFICI